ncbi:glycosyltransferase family 4 protein [Pelotomaculum sp. PtaB.Bin117]|uniref:glycosyltransferase family 4 protein n=1 Tax=Pelotomaculum sp. PtaB.Bin117 TaxID=1811694 RepID=UPI0009CD909B|nr:glycosyltransferase family 4 protein [Pelotomaculum sp. PtaB.Bin117]OPX87373.1 MAG: D-inositol 3-phosphate glycosyltransferase [Pelotomaculum sp. PtaB.Bin117]
MKILMVLDANDGRGMYRHGYILAKELAILKHKVSIVYIDPEESVSHEDNVKVYKICGFIQKFGFLYAQSNVRHHAPVPDGVVVKKLEGIIEAEQPDLIHVHGWVLYSVAKLKSKFKVPLITTLHDYGYFCPTKTLLRDNRHLCEQHSLNGCLNCGKKFYGVAKDLLTLYGVRTHHNLLNSSVDKYIAVSSYVKQRYVSAGFPEEKITVIPNFYNPAEMAQGTNDHVNELPEDFILYVGEFTPFKGVDILAEAFSGIKTKTKLVLMGRPKYAGLRKDNIIVFENPPRKLVVTAFKKCRFVVIPSIWADPCPTVAFEAMACGKAIVASNIGGLQDIVKNNKTGILVEPGDKGKLADVIELSLNKGDYSEKFINNFFKKHFSLKKVVASINDYYQLA